MSFNVGDIKLGGVSLNNSLQWVDRYSYIGVAQARKRTLGGGLVVFSQGLTKGRDITLTATIDTGWFTYEMVNDLIALAESPISSYVFEYHTEFYTVRFNYEGSAVGFTPLIPKATYADESDYFIGTMKLFTV